MAIVTWKLWPNRAPQAHLLVDAITATGWQPIRVPSRMKWPRTEPLSGRAPFGSRLFPATILSARKSMSNQNVAERLDFELYPGPGVQDLTAVGSRPTQRARRFGFMGRSKQVAGEPLSHDADMLANGVDESRTTVAFSVVNRSSNSSWGVIHFVSKSLYPPVNGKA